MHAGCLQFYRGLLMVLAATAAAPTVRAAVEELDDARALTFQIKTNDAIVVGIFDKKGSKEEGMIRQVAKDMAPDGGIKFFVTYDSKTAKKYLGASDGDPAASPAVGVFSNFDPETGTSKKHVKGKAFSADFEYAGLFKFVFVEGLPMVTRIPINMGPDASKRMRIATSSGMPKLFRFSKSELPKDPEAQDSDGAYLRACTALRGKLTAYAVLVTGGEHDEGASYMENFGLDAEDLGDEPIIMLNGETYDGSVDDDAAIVAWATEQAGGGAADWSPTSGPSVMKKKKKSKKDL